MFIGDEAGFYQFKFSLFYTIENELSKQNRLTQWERECLSFSPRLRVLPREIKISCRVWQQIVVVNTAHACSTVKPGFPQLFICTYINRKKQSNSSSNVQSASVKSSRTPRDFKSFPNNVVTHEGFQENIVFPLVSGYCNKLKLCLTGSSTGLGRFCLLFHFDPRLCQTSLKKLLLSWSLIASEGAGKTPARLPGQQMQIFHLFDVR